MPRFLGCVTPIREAISQVRQNYHLPLTMFSVANTNTHKDTNTQKEANKYKNKDNYDKRYNKQKN